MSKKDLKNWRGILKINEFLRHSSASSSIMGRGIYNGKKAYFKCFSTIDKDKHTKALFYEAEVYKYIAQQSDDIKKYFVYC